ncbi:helix-turn-helix domain-containing protein [Streptomyces sp. NBC_01435]|uniref:helix-turn-helix domain-containing protein n=1 Tax=Streptomyces sp. NBC_01435 TaxID=2903865 RepID=UPI002E32B2BD|nr:helix-turn-helix domain-containing protein [Streptomyces sp. NBC_01435]
MIAASQWLNTTTGRIATDPYSWMQSVHWVGGSGLYTPSRNYGPKWGPTTVLIAQELSALTECRPGIEYLARKLKLSKRTVQYHLDMLREAGLLVYRTKGTRITGSIRHASVYERVIPVEFDEALGIRTVQRDETAAAYTRVPVGIAEEGRKLIGKLAKKAARKVRRRRSKTSVPSKSRCTPMQGGTSAFSSAGTSTSPSETKLASGSTSHPTPKKATSGPQKLNTVGRRYQLGQELVTNVPWLQHASAPRISWIARHCADAGWTWREVQAAAEEHSPIDPADTRRPSGLLAHRIKGAHLLYADPTSRRLMVTEWEDSRTQEHFRHAGYDQPAQPVASRTADQAMRSIRTVLSQPAPDDCTLHAAGDLDITTLSRDEVLEHRAFAADPEYVRAMLTSLGDRDTRRLLTNKVVDQALVLTRHDDYALAPAF